MSVHQRYPQPLEDQRQFFDELITEEWHTYHSEAWDAARRYEVEQLFRHLQPGRVLDIGCGVGFHDVEMARYPFVTFVEAIDYSRESIRKANEHYPHEKVFRRVEDLRTLAVEPSYDLVVSFQVFEHLSNPEDYFRFAIAACRPGGAIAILTPNADRLDNRIRAWRGEPKSMIDPQHFHEYTSAELRALGARHRLATAATFGYRLSSALWPWAVPVDPIRAMRWGTRLPAIADGLAVIFRKAS